MFIIIWLIQSFVAVVQFHSTNLRVVHGATRGTRRIAAQKVSCFNAREKEFEGGVTQLFP
jgi:hypothetical protein